MDLNKHIDVAEQFPRTRQQDSMVQDNLRKTEFALKMISRLPQEPAKTEEPPRVPSLGAMAISN